MNLKVQVRTLDVFAKIVSGNMNKISFIDYVPQKETCKCGENKSPLPRSTPEEQGISSGYLQKFLEELDEEESIHTQGIMITRNGSVILEGAFKPYDLNTWRVTHSLSKTLVGIATGIAIEEGFFHIDDTVASLLKKENTSFFGNRKKEVTIRNLLRMSSGIAFNEIGVVIDSEWTEDFLQSQYHFEPGKEFQYNSMNTYMLSAVIQETTGQTLEHFLKERFFEPLGIEEVFWELSPEKKTKGGWGLYITLEDRTKIGQLFLNHGKWNEKQIVSKEWLETMTKKYMSTPEHMNLYGYGYQVWIGKRKGSFIFNGVLGQNTIVYPDLNMVISIISSNSDMFVNSKLMDIVDRYFADAAFAPDERMKKNLKEYKKLQNYIAGLHFQKEFQEMKMPIKKPTGWTPFVPRKRNRLGDMLSDLPEHIDNISFSVYRAEENDIGIMPMFMQVLQNNYAKGITKFQFKKASGTLTLFWEEADQKCSIPIGFKQPKYSMLHFCEECHRIAAWGSLKRNEDDIPVLKLQVSFLETTNCRNMSFYFYKDHVLLKVKEIPDPNKVIDKVIPFLAFPLPSGSIGAIKNTDLVQGKITHMMEPEVNAYPLN